MFDDFRKDPTSGQERKRFGGSMAAAFAIYTGAGAMLVAASATARHIVQEEETQVEFAPPPEPEPPPPEPEPAQVQKASSPRPKAKRPDLKPPDKISDEKLKESDAALAEAGEGGPVDGFLDGVEGGRGNAPPPPPPKAEPLTKPVDLGNNERPKYPKAALRKGIEGSVVVAFDVLENGRTANPKIMSGPEEFHETVLKMALTWKFRPAMRGKTPVRHRMTKRVTFRLEDA